MKRLELETRVGLRLSEVRIKELKKLSKKTFISVSEHIRRAVDQSLDKQREKQKRPYPTHGIMV